VILDGNHLTLETLRGPHWDKGAGAPRHAETVALTLPKHRSRMLAVGKDLYKIQCGF